MLSSGLGGSHASGHTLADERAAREAIELPHSLFLGFLLSHQNASARGDSGRLVLAPLLKARRDLGYFAAPVAAHPVIAGHFAAQLGTTAPQAWADEILPTKSLYRYQAAVHSHLSVTPYSDAAEQMVTRTSVQRRP